MPRQQVLGGKARVFIRVVDPDGRVIDIGGFCDAIEVDTNFSKVGRGRMIAENPIGEIRFDNLRALAFMLAEPGHSLDRFMHDDSLPTREDIYSELKPAWWQVLGAGTVMNDLQRIVYA